jgi:chromosome partitioning protein
VTTVVGFVSEKGGTGKTTACYHIAIALKRYHGQRVLVIDADYQRGGITGRFFPDLIETFGSGEIPGTSLFHKFQQLYSASARSPDVDFRTWKDGAGGSTDVVVADPRLSGVTVDKLPSTSNIRQNNRLLFQHMQTIDYVLNNLADRYDFVLIDSHPEVSDVLRSVIYASKYSVSPVKLDRQSSIGVATVIGEINNVNADVEMIRNNLTDIEYVDTVFAGSMGMMCREWGASLKQTEQLEYNRLRRTGGVFENYITEGDGLRQAAARRVPVYDVSGSNADKQSAQFRALTEEFLKKCG